MEYLFMFGEAGTGKDTVADQMLWYYNIQSVALAHPIRAEYERFFGKTDHKQNRPKMIEIGETYKTLYGQDVWCAEAERFIRKQERSEYLVSPRGWLIRDGRYQHEYDYFVRMRGYVPIRLVADPDVRLERLKRRDGDAQLTALDFETKHFISPESFGYALENNGTIDDLRGNIGTLLEQIREYKS